MDLVAIYSIGGISVFCIIVYTFTINYFNNLLDKKIKIIIENMKTFIENHDFDKKEVKNERIEKKD